MLNCQFSVIQGTVRRIHFAAPANPALRQPDTTQDTVIASLAVLFGNGAIGVWELYGFNELKAVRPPHAASTAVAASS